MLLTPEQIDLLPSEELRPLLKKFLAEFDALLKRVEDLEAENERLKQRVDESSNSRNSSQPPSRDQKTNKGEKKHRKPGPPFVHKSDQGVPLGMGSSSLRHLADDPGHCEAKR